MSEAAAFLERKIALYPATGSHAVWVAYPESRKVRTHLAEGIARLLREDRYLVSRFLEGI